MRKKTTIDANSEAIDPNLARKQLESASTMHWFHWVIVAGSLLLTLFAWSYSKSEKDARIQAQFDREAEQVVELVRERMKKYEDALWAGVALIHTSGGDIDHDHWQQYANSIHIGEKYPGISGIGVIHSVSDAELAEYLSIQQQRRPEYRIHPEHSGKQYLPISYVTPVEGNEKAVGLDIAHEANRFAASQKARDTGRSQITGPITLVQDTGKTPGFLFYAPFYSGGTYDSLDDRQSSFLGMVYAPFVVKKLMEGTLEKDKRHVGIRILDQEEVLYDEHLASEADYDPNPLFTHSVNFELYGRTWTFDIWSAQSFREASSDSQPLIILIGGIFIDVMLILLFFSISRSSHRALEYADSMTSQLQKNTDILKAKATELEKTNENLSRFNRTATDREIRMIELKQQVNELREQAGKPRQYDIVSGALNLAPIDSSISSIEQGTA